MSWNKALLVAGLSYVGFICWPGTVRAEAAGEKRPLDLPACIEQALKANPQIKEAALEVREAEWQLKSAELGRTPEVELFNLMGVTEDAEEGPEGAAITGDNVDGSYGFFNRMNLNISVPLYTFGRLSRSIDAASHNVTLRVASRAKTRNELILKVHTLYYGLVLSRQLLESTRDIKENFTEARDIAEERLEKGEPTVVEADVLKLRVGLAGIAKAVRKLERKTRIIKESLGETLGFDEQDEFSIATERLEPVDFHLGRLDSYLSQAKANNPDLKRLRAAVQAEKSRYLAAKAKCYPTLLAVGGVRYAEAPGRPDLDNPFLDDDYNYFSAGGALAIKWDLNLFRKNATVQEKKATYLKMESRLREGVSGIALKVREKYHRVAEKKDGLEWSFEARKAGRALLVLSLTNFKFGIGSGKDLFDALSLYTRTSSDYYKAVYEYNMAVAELRSVIADQEV
jgi:outer membrane protein TolC